jgi:hypothetical protein
MIKFGICAEKINGTSCLKSKIVISTASFKHVLKFTDEMYAERWLEHVESIKGTTFDEENSQYIFQPNGIDLESKSPADWWIDKAVNVRFTKDDHVLTMESFGDTEKTVIYLHFTSDEERTTYMNTQLKRVKPIA